MENIHEEGKMMQSAVDHADIVAVVSSAVASANKDVFEVVEPLIQ